MKLIYLFDIFLISLAISGCSRVVEVPVYVPCEKAPLENFGTPQDINVTLRPLGDAVIQRIDTPVCVDPRLLGSGALIIMASSDGTQSEIGRSVLVGFGDMKRMIENKSECSAIAQQYALQVDIFNKDLK